jgi:hypothetical protein
MPQSQPLLPLADCQHPRPHLLLLLLLQYLRLMLP